VRLVLDTNVVVAALLSQRGASAELIRLGVRRRVVLIGTLSLALEYLDVCGRPEVLSRCLVSAADAARFANEVVALLTPIEVRYRWRPAGPDADDDHVIEAALNGGANAIVTFNRKDFAEASRRFNLRVVTPSAILGELESSDG
jgi:putative PIN family toxin of toxin-antitoxin system